jgi:hypothetical protein
MRNDPKPGEAGGGPSTTKICPTFQHGLPVAGEAEAAAGAVAGGEGAESARKVAKSPKEGTRTPARIIDKRFYNYYFPKFLFYFLTPP